jgi:hypothetical protein
MLPPEQTTTSDERVELERASDVLAELLSSVGTTGRRVIARMEAVTSAPSCRSPTCVAYAMTTIVGRWRTQHLDESATRSPMCRLTNLSGKLRRQ